MSLDSALDRALKRGSKLLAPASESRFQRIRMGVGELFEILKTGHLMTLSSAVPRNARVRHVSYSELNHCFELLIEDDSFEPVEELARVPIIEGPAFAVFELGFEPMKAFLEQHAGHLVDQLRPEYADTCQLARAPEPDDRWGAAPDFDRWLEERD